MQKQQELKYNDNWEKIQACNAPSGTFSTIYTQVIKWYTLGTSVTERIGSAVTATSLSFRGFMYVPNLQTIENEDDLSRVPFGKNDYILG